MGVAEAIIISSLIAGGTAAIVSEEQRKSSSKAASKQRKTAAALAAKNKDRLKVTPKSRAKKGARSAIVVGSPRGILNAEDQAAVSGRGTLLGN